MYCYECMNEIKDGSKHCGYCGKSTEINVHPHHLKPGTILHNQYLVGNSIGEGGFGITYVGKDLSLDMKIAIKEYYPSGYANRNNTVSNNVTLNYQNEGSYFQNGVEHFLREAKSIAKFHNERGIVDVRAFFEENDTAYIIMEYLDGENLSDKIRSGEKYEASEIFRLFLPMMNTLEKMHRENIIHRDISPENIRINPNGELTLMDFGSARYYSGMEKKTMSVQFKPGYAPFEQYNKNGNQGPWTDVYGLCATIYKCITGVTPVDSLERSQNDSLELPSSLGAKISEPLEKVLMYGMAISPSRSKRFLCTVWRSIPKTAVPICVSLKASRRKRLTTERRALQRRARMFFRLVLSAQKPLMKSIRLCSRTEPTVIQICTATPAKGIFRIIKEIFKIMIVLEICTIIPAIRIMKCVVIPQKNQTAV